MKVVVRCVYCDGVAVYRDTYDKAVCPCGETRIAKHRDAMTGYDVINVWADNPESNGYSKNAPPAQLPAEEAAARLNVASLVDRIAALEQGVSQDSYRLDRDVTGLLTRIEAIEKRADERAVIGNALVTHVTALRHRVDALETETDGPVIAARLGEYLRAVRS